MNAKKNGEELKDGDISSACVDACPTDALVFGNQKDDNSRVSKMKNDKRSYTLLDNLQTSPNIFYLAKIDHDKEEGTHH